MRRKVIGGILVLMMAVSLCACSSGASDASKKDSAEKTTSSEVESKTVAQKEDTGSDEEKANDLPVGYVGEDGYYNSYFGFKLVPPDGDNEDGYAGGSFTRTFIETVGNEMDAASIDGEKSLEDVLTEKLESDKHVTAYIPSSSDGSMKVGNTSFICKINVAKIDTGVKEEEYIANDVSTMLSTGSYQKDDLKQGTIQFLGEERGCISWTKESQNDVNKHAIYLRKGEYECIIAIGDPSDFDAACAAFEKF